MTPEALPTSCYARSGPTITGLDERTLRSLVTWHCHRYLEALATTPTRGGLFTRAKHHRAFGQLDATADTVAVLLDLAPDFVDETMSRCDRLERAWSHPSTSEAEDIAAELLAAWDNRPPTGESRDDHETADRGAK